VTAVFILQYFFLFATFPVSEGAIDQGLFLAETLSGEGRETAWVYSEWNHRPYLGKTYLAALLPIPSFISDFKNTYSASGLTLDLLGIDRDSGHGGIRLTAWGEAYMNFFYIGVAAISLLFAKLLRHADLLMERSRSLPALALVPVVFLIIFGIFQSYAAGSVGLSDGALTTLALWWVSGAKREA
jgi:hypothetical protein